MRDMLQAGAGKPAYSVSSPEPVALHSSFPMNQDPYEHFATREALAEVATRLDATLPHLATRADVERVSNRLLFWLTGTLVTCLLTFYGLHANLMASQQEQMRDVQMELRALASQQQQFAEQFARQQQRMSDQIERLASQPDERLRRPQP
jgi:hypothetical protein